MTFEEFRVVVLTELTKMLDDGLKAELKEVTKTNDIIEHGILITGEGSRVSPIFYLDSFYEEFRESYNAY